MNENEEKNLNENVQTDEPINNSPEETEVKNENPNQEEAEVTNENINIETPINNENTNKEEQKKEEQSNWYWIIYIAVVIIIFIIILLLLRGCNSLRNRNKSKISEANEWVTNMWNKCVDPVYWYTVDGTGVEGAAIDIDNVLADCDKYYDEYKTKKSEITNLGDEYSDFKETYSKISEQIEIIYPKIKANKPVAEENVDYEENMETFYEYQVKLYNIIKEKYS